MTDEQINSKIAEVRGWSGIRKHPDTGELRGYDNQSLVLIVVPDYANDLNAIHEAVMAQSDDVKWVVFEHLTNIVSADIPAACADSREWAEAFLKTLNLWEYGE